MRRSSKSKLHVTLGLLALASLVVAVGAAIASGGDDEPTEDLTAIANIHDCRTGELLGNAVLTERASDQGIKTVKIKVTMDGLEPGMHGMHIHETAECEPCAAAGGHFDPGPAGSASPDGNHPFHMGDLVNISPGGRRSFGKVSTVSTRFTLSPGPLSIFDDDGSAIVIKDGEDTFCPTGPEPGCAGGSRLACGVLLPM